MDLYLLLLTLIFFISSVKSEISWAWECVDGFCQKHRITPATKPNALSLAACRLLCSSDIALWPKPNGELKKEDKLISLNFNKIHVSNFYERTPIGSRIDRAIVRFKDILDGIEPDGNRENGAIRMNVLPYIKDTNVTRLALQIDESYTLKLEESRYGHVKVIIESENYFGFRHGLETLSQLVIYDDIRDEYQTLKYVHIQDKPAYTYRGIALDTSRNYISVDTIKRTLEGMATTKLNTFHWHITDAHSFPFVSLSRPELSKIGAYEKHKVYTPEHVADIVEYGLVRGVRVMPEFDAPAHVGEGWQDTGFLKCFNAKPWQNYCTEPPCGQLDPTQEKLYDFLEGIYYDMIKQFDPDIFHMGGDEVSFSCWNATPSIVEWMENEKGWLPTRWNFLELWGYFQSKALERYKKQAGANNRVIMWSSKLTAPESINNYLPKSQYIIQFWGEGRDSNIRDILSKGYDIILSNYDGLYFDCGFGSWVDSGNNWCSPYVGWQKVYDNSPESIAGFYRNQVLGAEGILWSEQADSSTVDGRLWPRAAALAERLWTEPTTKWRTAEQRILVQRERLVKRGIQADVLEPEWCLQNEENCPISGQHNS